MPNANETASAMENVTEATLALMKAALSSPSAMLQKSVTTGTGLVPFDLQAPSKNLYPVSTPLRNVIPRVGGGSGLATNWKSIFGITGSGWDAMGWVPEGQRTARMSYSAVDKAASYRTLGEEDNISFEAINAGKSFEDVISTGVMRILQKMMLKEENGILGGNNSIALGVTPTPTLSASGSGGTLPAITYDVACIALSYEGYRNSSLANGVAGQKTVTGADGSTYLLNGGMATPSAIGTQAVTSGQTLFMSVAPVSGAFAYAWYIGASGAAKLEIITTINSASLAVALVGTHETLASKTVADYSKNTLAFDGLLYSAIAGGGYNKALATGTAGTGTFLTASGRGGVNEIDDMLLRMWQDYQVSPNVLWCNAQEVRHISDKVLSGGSGPLLRYDAGGSNPYAIVANGTVEAYFNPFALDGGTKMPIKIHPMVPPGTIIGWNNNLPQQYQSNNVPNVAEMKIRADYYSIEWPIKTRAREYGVYCEEVLAVYAPFAMGMITNIGNG